MKGCVTCLTCNIFLKRANMMYHLAQCSAESPFCTNTDALRQKQFDKEMDELAALSDTEVDVCGVGRSEAEEDAVEEEEDEEDLDGPLGRVLLD